MKNDLTGRRLKILTIKEGLLTDIPTFQAFLFSRYDEYGRHLEGNTNDASIHRNHRLSDWFSRKHHPGSSINKVMEKDPPAEI